MISRRDIPRVCPKSPFVLANNPLNADIHGVCSYIEIPTLTFKSELNNSTLRTEPTVAVLAIGDSFSYSLNIFTMGC